MRYQQQITCFCDGCPAQGLGALRVVAVMGKGEIGDVQPPKGWASVVVRPSLAFVGRRELSSAWLPAQEVANAFGADVGALFCGPCNQRRLADAHRG